MSKSGGPATLYGVYISSSRRWSSQLALNATLEDESLQCACLIINLVPEVTSLPSPITGLNNGSPDELGITGRFGKLSEVVPDLFRSIQSEWVSQATQFRFCSEGGMSDGRQLGYSSRDFGLLH